MAIRKNLVRNPSFEVDLAGWISAINPATVPLSRTTSGAAAGSYALTISNSSASTMDASTLAGVNGFPVTPGLTYTASGTVTTSAAISLRVYLNFYTSTGAVATAPFTATTTSASVPLRISTKQVAPANAAFAAIMFRWSNAGAGSSFSVDAVLVEESTTLNDYFDGSSVKAGFTYGWEGTAHNSASTENNAATTPTPPTITSELTGEGTPTATLGGFQRIVSNSSGEGTPSATLGGYQRITSEISSEGTPSATLSAPTPAVQTITSNITGEGTPNATLVISKRIDSSLTSEGVLSATISAPTPEPEIPPVVHEPADPDQAPLGKLSAYRVSTHATPLNPAKGSGSVPSVSATFMAGVDPEYALGTEARLENSRIGDYSGEIVTLSTAGKSDRVPVTIETPLSRLNIERKVFPYIEASRSTSLPRQAVDYWTQQCGLFYDDVPGDALMYSSGYGHAFGYLKGFEDRRYYPVLQPGAGTAPKAEDLGTRIVRTFGADATTHTTVLSEKIEQPTFTFPFSDRLAFSAGFGLRGTGRTSEVSWFLTALKKTYIVTLKATSDGTITVVLRAPRGVVVNAATATVPAGSSYRVALSLGRPSATSVSVKLTVHTDDLNGNGELLVSVPATTQSFALPATFQLTNVKHSSAGGSGSLMYHYGTYFSVVGAHPLTLPVVQKALGLASKPSSYVTGFRGNVWKLINEYTSMFHLELSFNAGKLRLAPRTTAITSGISLSSLSTSAARRDKFKKVKLINRKSLPSASTNTVLWRADSVYQVNPREINEFTVQTDHSILELSQPKPVGAILPFPYKKGAGQYVVTGADGYIIAPQWWTDNGGKIEVALTDREGEISVKITAPAIDSVRAPYRISEGAGDRPALYVSGAGVINKPEEIEVSTGARNAKEGSDAVFDSPFLTDLNAIYTTAAAMSREYSAGMADISISEPGQFDKPSVLGQYPAGKRFTDGKRVYTLESAEVTHSTMSGSGSPSTTIRDYKASFKPGSTIKDEKSRFRGLTIRHQNITPLKER